MLKRPFLEDSYSPQFSGHETFPLRYGWLKKAYDRVVETEGEIENRAACWGDDSIARFGVGKNMVASIRHWAKAVGIIIEKASRNSVETTELGRILFGANGFDPYMEYPATQWLIHWQLAAHPRKTTWFWSFSYYPSTTFERDDLVMKLERLTRDLNWSRVATATIKNDVACFIRSYVVRQPSGKTGSDDALESPLTELGIIKAIGRKDGFRFVRGPKSTLGNGVFAHALIDFWKNHAPNTATLSLEAVAHAPGSPGRVFAFNENDVADRLVALEDSTSGALRWSETAGLKQIVRSTEINDSINTFSWLGHDYDRNYEREAE